MHRGAMGNRRLFTACFIQELCGVILLFPTLVLNHKRGEFQHPARMEHNTVSRNTKFNPSKETSETQSKWHPKPQQSALTGVAGSSWCQAPVSPVEHS